MILTLVGAGTAAASAIALLVSCGAAVQGPTSVAVIVDFSGSFVRSGKSPHGAGLLAEDQRALTAVAEAIAEVASKYWSPPLKIVWTKITGSSVPSHLILYSLIGL